MVLLAVVTLLVGCDRGSRGIELQRGGSPATLAPVTTTGSPAPAPSASNAPDPAAVPVANPPRAGAAPAAVTPVDLDGIDQMIARAGADLDESTRSAEDDPSR